MTCRVSWIAPDGETFTTANITEERAALIATNLRSGPYSSEVKIERWNETEKTWTAKN